MTGSSSLKDMGAMPLNSVRSHANLQTSKVEEVETFIRNTLGHCFVLLRLNLTAFDENSNAAVPLK